MNLPKALRDHWLRIDARSLGLFRLAMGLVLFADLFRRWRYLKEFYSNDGVLPNHNHLFNLHDTGHVWSVLHAFSSVGEAETAFAFIFFFYACFLLGWHTRVFQVVALACLVSLDARNVLLENAGTSAGIALLAFTVFLPLGSRFSLDSLRTSLEERDEKSPRALNDRRLPSPESIQAARDPGWTPTSVAALATLAQISLIYLALALQQKGALWQDGTALYYALNAERWVSGAGVTARHLGGVGLAAWTRAFHYSALAIPALIFFPFAWRTTRGVAVGLVVFTGLTVGVFFSFGLFGWTLVASAALLVPTETWDHLEDHPRARLARTVIYDVDCGVCLWISRVLKRLDLRGNLTFQGNDDLGGLNARAAGGTVSRRDLPAAVTADLVANTVVVVAPDGTIATRARAVAEVVQALPLGWLVAWAMKLPGIVHLLGALYDFVAARRQRLSVAMGKAACGIEAPHEDGEEELVSMGETAKTPALPAPEIKTAAPATRLRRGATGLVRELAALVVLAAMVAQTAAANDLPWAVPQPKWLASVAAWPRMKAHWDVLTTVTTDDEAIAVDAVTRGGRSLDPFTGKEPVLDPGEMRGTGLGQLWNDYLWRIRQREWFDYQRAFRDYLNKGGPGWDGKTGDDQIVGYDAYWIKQPIPAPGEPRAAGVTTREKFMTQARGGKSVAPLLRPDLFKR